MAGRASLDAKGTSCPVLEAGGQGIGGWRRSKGHLGSGDLRNQGQSVQLRSGPWSCGVRAVLSTASRRELGWEGWGPLWGQVSKYGAGEGTGRGGVPSLQQVLLSLACTY